MEMGSTVGLEDVEGSKEKSELGGAHDNAFDERTRDGTAVNARPHDHRIEEKRHLEYSHHHRNKR